MICVFAPGKRPTLSGPFVYLFCQSIHLIIESPMLRYPLFYYASPTLSLSLALLSHYFLTISSRQSWNLFWISVKNMFLRINLLYIFICLWKNSFYILYIVYILIYLSLSTGYFNNNQYLWSLLLISVIVKQFTAK